jgi:hypothetical protein
MVRCLKYRKTERFGNTFGNTALEYVGPRYNHRSWRPYWPKAGPIPEQGARVMFSKPLDSYHGQRWVIGAPNGALVEKTVNDRPMLRVFKTKERAESVAKTESGKLRALESDTDFFDLLRQNFNSRVTCFNYDEAEGTDVRASFSIEIWLIDYLYATLRDEVNRALARGQE